MFTTTALKSNIRSLNDAEFNSLKKHYNQDPRAFSFLSGYDPEDVTLTSFDGRALSIWGISPASQAELINDLYNDTTTTKLSLTFEVKFQREPDKALPADLNNFFEVDLRKLDPSVRHAFAAVINGTSSETVKVNQVFPRFLRLGTTTKATKVDQLIGGSTGIHLSNISMTLNTDAAGGLSEWWDVNERILGATIFTYADPDVVNTVNKISIITFNDKKAPESLSFLSGYGIIGLYISFILLIGRLLRLSTTNQYLTIMFRELPDVDYIMRLVLDLYLVREMKEFRLEEDLYATLIFLYRSPETTIKVTRQTVRIGNLKKKND
ncbi:piezo-type mechanosensitive ion channel component 1 [Aplysia californica]|uniref:Piezo-type mechanosensitive ion channel component 1 n=1 Tax=Aplysia californica TaxID=6500 RepID=A0ABM1AES9_APLCA|nr:piezo-type mechanosensitive ion channel component 1 [Aplysia californica]